MKKTNKKLALRKNVIARLAGDKLPTVKGGAMSGPCGTIFTTQCPETLNRCITRDC